MRRHEGTVLTDSCISVTTVMDVSQLYGATWQHVVTYRLCRVVKHKSCETYWILLGTWLMTTHVSFEVTVPSIVTNWAAERWSPLWTVAINVDGTVTLSKRHMRRHSRLPQSMLNTSADHLNDQLTITVFFFVSSHIYTINCSHLQAICVFLI